MNKISNHGILSKQISFTAVSNIIENGGIMQPFPSTVVWRHRKENLKKCSLSGLEKRSDFQFFTYPGELPNLSNYILLTLDGPPLTSEDASCGLFIVDATWRYADIMLKRLESKEQFHQRSIPSCYRTAYPRHQTGCVDPIRGLASIEAIYVAYYLLGRDPSGLLDNYYWKESFLEVNNLKRIVNFN